LRKKNPPSSFAKNGQILVLNIYQQMVPKRNFREYVKTNQAKKPISVDIHISEAKHVARVEKTSM
jgi:hypothetical protein